MGKKSHGIKWVWTIVLLSYNLAVVTAECLLKSCQVAFKPTHQEKRLLFHCMTSLHSRKKCVFSWQILFKKKDYLVKEITARIIGRRKFSLSQSRRLNEVFFRTVAIPSGFHIYDHGLSDAIIGSDVTVRHFSLLFFFFCRYYY